MSNDVQSQFNPQTGLTDNFFGGVGSPDGRGHGHIRADEQGNLSIKRHPYPPGVPYARRNATEFDTRGSNPFFNPADPFGMGPSQ